MFAAHIDRTGSHERRRAGQRRLRCSEISPKFGTTKFGTSTLRSLLADGERAVRRRRILLHDGQPLELSASYYPASIADDTLLSGPGKIAGGAPKVLANLSMPPRAFVDRVSARPPTREEVEALDLPVRAPVIRQLRVLLSDDDRPVEASVLVKGAHLYELQFRRLVPELDQPQP